MNFEEIRQRLAAFAEARNWAQFHSLKNLSMVPGAELDAILPSVLDKSFKGQLYLWLCAIKQGFHPSAYIRLKAIARILENLIKRRHRERP